MFETASAATSRFAAHFADLGKGSNKNGLGGGDLLEPAREHTTDVAWVAGNAHASPPIWYYIKIPENGKQDKVRQIDNAGRTMPRLK